MLRFLPSATTPPATHEELFLQRYERLAGQARQLTSRDEQLAEDLVHEAFVQFTLARPALDRIENLDAYLYGMLRKLHISHLRRASRLQYFSATLVDYDSLDMGLRALDAGAQLRCNEELRLICQYACTRRETSKAGSVLLLRFFHGYYPSEIARLIGSPRSAVDDWLRIARREAKLYLSDPRALSFMTQSAAMDFAATGIGQTPVELLHGLRRAIFATRHQECFTPTQLQQLYPTNKTVALDSVTLAQLVSCPHCLDQVNRLLGLPLLAERFPTDMLGPEKPKDGGPGGTGGTGSEVMNEKETRAQRRRRDVFEHRPTELHFTVNGFVLSSLHVNAARSEQSQRISLDEKISFVEVFSEQGARLLFLDVDVPPDGAIEQTAQATLSDDRRLDLRLSFADDWPTLHAIYLDPLLKGAAENAEQTADSRQQTVAEETRAQAAPFADHTILTDERARSGWRWLTGAFWLRPATITAIVSLLLIAALVLVRLPVRVSAAELLRKSRVAETAMAARTDQALHRTIALEERNAADGRLLAQRRIEIWHSAARHETARRVFDENNRLIAGEWRGENSTRSVWRQGEKLGPLNDNSLSFTPESVWMISPSAQDFTALTGNADEAKVTDQQDKWLVSYENQTDQDGLVSASLLLNKDDLHALAQTLLVRNSTSDPQLREYRFTETSFARPASNTVAPAVFAPDPALTAGVTKDENGKAKEAAADKQSATAAPVVTASAELELEALERMNRANALTGEQLFLLRTPEGRLVISGIVETETRKRELLAALDVIRTHPAVRVNIQTVAEAQAQQQPSSASPVTVQQLEVTEQTIPVTTELTQYLTTSKGLSGAQVAPEIRRLAGSVLSQSAQARQHALALKQIAGRFSAADLAAMDASARARWHALIRERAQALRSTLGQLRAELSPIFPATATTAAAEAEISSDEELMRAVQRLFDLAVATDSGMRRSFTLSTAQANDAPVRTAQFWRAFSRVEALVARITEMK